MILIHFSPEIYKIFLCTFNKTEWGKINSITFIEMNFFWVTYKIDVTFILSIYESNKLYITNIYIEYILLFHEFYFIYCFTHTNNIMLFVFMLWYDHWIFVGKQSELT